MRTLLFALAVIGVVGACDGEKPAKAAKGSAAVQPPPPPTTVDIFVDDKPVGKIATDQVALWPRLDSLVPTSARRLGTWDTLSIKHAVGAPTQLQKPSTAYPELVPVLFPGEGGAPSFGMFDAVELAKKGNPSLREDGVTEIRVVLSHNAGRGENDHQGGEAVDPTKLELTIKSPTGDTNVTGIQLLGMKRTPPPGEEDAKGWPLSAILALGGVTKYQKIVVSDAKGNSLTLEKQDLDPNKSIPYVKLNRQGALRFIVYKKQGVSWQRGGDLRGLAHVEILK